MKKLFILLSAFFVLACFMMSCSETTSTQTNTNTSDTAKVVYTCPMHPEVISDKPGKCPKCGMDLVIKK